MVYERPKIKGRVVKNFLFRSRNSLRFLEDCGEVAKNI